MNSPELSILANLIAAKAAVQPEMGVLTFVDVALDGKLVDETRNYRELWQNGQRIAAGLIEAGMAQGDAFGLVMQNHPEMIEAMVGSSIAGTVFVPIDARTRGKKLTYMLDFAECKGVIVADYALAPLKEILAELPRLKWVWVLETGADDTDPGDLPEARYVSEVLRAPVPELAVRTDSPLSPMQLLYTSGTTGDPKAIMGSCLRFGMMGEQAKALGLRTDDRLYSGLSLTHSNAQITLAASLYLGLPAVFSRRFTKSRLWDITRRYGCTMFNLLGGMTTAVYSEPERPDDADNPVRLVLSAGMPKVLWDQFRTRFGVEIFEIYGAAEGGLLINPPGVGPAGSIGKPPPTLEARIADEQGRECRPGARGEIQFRNADGSSPVVQYFKNPEASARKTEGGWLHMGDIGYRDAEGWFYFLYREGGGIRRNGDFVSPAFVERELAEHPLIDDVFVYGISTPDCAPGEKQVVAAVVMAAGKVLDPRAVFEHCRARLEANMVPSFLQVVDQIPKTASEKPQERFLAEAFDPAASNVYAESNS